MLLGYRWCHTMLYTAKSDSLVFLNHWSQALLDVYHANFRLKTSLNTHDILRFSYIAFSIQSHCYLSIKGHIFRNNLCIICLSTLQNDSGVESWWHRLLNRFAEIGLTNDPFSLWWSLVFISSPPCSHFASTFTLSPVISSHGNIWNASCWIPLYLQTCRFFEHR